MEPMVLCVVGAGNPFLAPTMLGTLASYFGERSIDLRLYDPSAEMVDLFDRLARLLFKLGKADHSIRSGDKYAELLEGADRVLLMLEDRSAKILVGAREDAVEEAHALVSKSIPAGCWRLTVDDDLCRMFNWPVPDRDAPKPGLLLQISRYLLAEESPMHLIADNDRSLFKSWLDGRFVEPTRT